MTLNHSDVGAQVAGNYVQEGAGGTVSGIKIVVGARGSDPNTLYFVV